MNFEALPADEFLEEAQELLQEIEESLLLLEEDPVDQNVIQRLFRSAHTLKGGAAMVGLSDLANHAHEFEAILSQLRSGTLTSTPEIVSLLLKGKDNFSSLLNPIIGNSTSSSSHSTNENQPTHQLTDIQSPQESRTSDLKSDNPQIQKNVYLLHLHFDQSFLEQGQEPLLLIRQLEGLGETTVIVHTSQIPPWTEFDQQKLYLWWSIKLVTEKTAEEIDTLLEFYRWKESDLSIEKVETPVEEAKEVQDAHQNMLQQISDGESVDQLTFAESTKTQYEDPEEAVEIPKVSQTIRVPVSRLDRLQNLVSETVIRQARLLRLNEAIQATDDELGEQFLQFVEDNEQAVRELQDQIQQVRMVPVGTIFSPMKRVVREFATRHQKQIKLEIYGAETELDKTITEQIQGSLMHLLRNAMDHGLEAPEQRRESAKNPIGTITLQASHQAGFVVVEVKDDGRGLDPDKILAAGRRLGIVAEDHHPSEQEALQLIFQPGFTTTREVTDVSGRGVGMDAVKKDIEALLGNIEISSQLGHGTTMKLKLPLSLAIIEGMLVRVGVEMFVLPLLLVTETLRPLPKQLKRFKNRGELIDIRGQYLPLVRLHQHLNIENAIEQPEEGLIIVVQQGSQNYCLLVDNIEDQLPVVIKSLEEHFVHIPGIAGATILGDGSVCFIIDVAAMLN